MLLKQLNCNLCRDDRYFSSIKLANRGADHCATGVQKNSLRSGPHAAALLSSPWAERRNPQL